MNITEWKNGWELWDLIAFLKHNARLSAGTIFRGQSKAEYKLIPDLYRRNVGFTGPGGLEDLFVTVEEAMIERFFDLAFLLLPNFARNKLLDRVIAQHYGIPTQILDWTLDPFIALYFAVKDHRSAHDAAFYYIYPLTGYAKSYPISFPYKSKISTFRPPVIDARVQAQKSVFTIQGFGSSDAFVPLDDRILKKSKENEGTHPEDEVAWFGKVIIPAKRKTQIFHQLLLLGVDSSLLFPGIQGIGERIADLADITRYGGGHVY